MKSSVLLFIFQVLKVLTKPAWKERVWKDSIFPRNLGDEPASRTAYRNRLLRLVCSLTAGKNTTVTARLQTEITLWKLCNQLLSKIRSKGCPPKVQSPLQGLGKKVRYLHLLHNLYLDSAVIDTTLKYEQRMWRVLSLLARALLQWMDRLWEKEDEAGVVRIRGVLQRKK